ncbi:MAG: alkaline phosphatase family protein [Candidatus Pacearchaeota archaeon]
MKGVLVILDGLGDLPSKQLGGKTPLEAANTPNLDFFATYGKTGYMYPVKPNFIPGSDESIVSLFGNNLSDSSRGQLEARGAGIKTSHGDLALRVNFASINSLSEGDIIDRRVGRTLTTKEAEILSKDLNKIKLSCNFIFKSTIQHRAVLVLKGGFSDNIICNDPIYSRDNPKNSEKISTFKALDEEEDTQYTVNILREFAEKAFELLDKHPINEKRRIKGFPPANYLLMRGAGSEIPKLKKYRKWLSIVYMPLEIGFSELSGMNVFSFEYPELKNLDSYENLWEGLKKACNFTIDTIKKNYKNSDYAYIHIKETDLPGHDNKPIEKKMMLEYLDKTLFQFLREFAIQKKIKIVVTGDHSTPCKLKSHSADPVPVLFYEGGLNPKESFFDSFLNNFNTNNIQKFFSRKEKNDERTKSKESIKKIKFCERTVKSGALGEIKGKDLLNKVGFNK